MLFLVKSLSILALLFIPAWGQEKMKVPVYPFMRNAHKRLRPLPQRPRSGSLWCSLWRGSPWPLWNWLRWRASTFWTRVRSLVFQELWLTEISESLFRIQPSQVPGLLSLSRAQSKCPTLTQVRALVLLPVEAGCSNKAFLRKWRMSWRVRSLES